MDHRKLIAFGVAIVVTAACTGGRSGGGEGRGKQIPQPVVKGLAVAPRSDRVDLAVPTFSNPTRITNPLFPVSKQHSVLFLGHVEGKPFRTEVTLLPDTRIIAWEGQRVETAISQYNAFLGGSIEEVAYDYYAQADDGSVWYFGEDVFDFRDGAIAVTEGTWLAGRDGPAAMIMPGHPHVGDVYRTENAPGFVFEEVTVKSVDTTLDGPLGPIQGGMVAQELHSDGTTERKLFAPGYGEFYTAGGGDVEALALAVPTDAASAPAPVELTTLSSEALSIVDAAPAAGWGPVRAAVKRMTDAWESFRAGPVPTLVEPVMNDALRVLARAVVAREIDRTRRAAIQVARSSFDLQLRYRPVEEIDLARLDLWAAQLLMDVAAGDRAALGADAFALDYVRDRLVRALEPAALRELNTDLGVTQVAIEDADMRAAAFGARRLRHLVAEIEPAH
jgi:hypothetical protein